MSPELTDLVERRFQVEGRARLRVENSSGETRVRGGADGEVVVRARKRTHSGSAEGGRRLLENLEVEIEQEGNEIRISQRAFMLERGWANVFREHRASVDYEIEVPRGSLVQVRSASGEIEVHATEGAVELQSVSGDINVSDARGGSRLRTVSGDVSAEQCAGVVEGNSVSGDFVLRACTWPSARLRTISGDVEAEVRLPGPGPVDLNTISGDIQLATGSPFELHFETTSGDLSGEGISLQKVGRRSFAARSGEGGADIHVRTVSGDLSIRATNIDVPGEPTTEEPSAVRADAHHSNDSEVEREEEPDVERTEPMDPEASQRVRGVLERLAKGEIGIDDAASALDEARRGR